jgi:hypothetical protein
VTGIALNGGTADVTIPGHAVIKAGTVMVS